MRIKKLLSLLLLTVPVLAAPVLVSAHGGVSIEDDVCVMTLGNMKAHFTGYQPEYRATQEFCEDIPVKGKSIFVIDFISDGLRDMIVDFRIIKDVNNIGNNAVLADLGGAEAIEAATIYHQSAKHYPRGTIEAHYDFSEEGRYIGIVTAHYQDDPVVLTSVFPFQVGLFNYWKYIVPLILIVLFSSAGFGVFLGMSKNQKPAT